MSEQKSKHALISGASSGIGKAVATLLAQHGYNIISISRKVSNFDPLKKELPESVELKVFEANLESDLEIFELIKEIEHKKLNIEILVHSAGIIIPNAVTDSNMDELNKQFNLNFKAPFLLTKLLIPILSKNNGQIVFINSSAIQRPIPNLSLYSASKFALKGFVDCLRQEINKLGIRVLSVYPGQTATAMQERLYIEGNKQYNPEKLIQPMDVAEVIVNSLKLNRAAEVTDLYLRPMLN